MSETHNEMKWIRVTKKMPEVYYRDTIAESYSIENGVCYAKDITEIYESEPVLAVGVCEGIRERVAATYNEWRKEDGTMESGWVDVFNELDIDDVTHWMPLPKMPRRRKNHDDDAG